MSRSCDHACLGERNVELRLVELELLYPNTIGRLRAESTWISTSLNSEMNRPATLPKYSYGSNSALNLIGFSILFEEILHSATT
jgi:hypothetical protein